VWASRLLRDPLPARVAGIDLMNALLALAERQRYRVFILGAERSVLETAVERIRARHPRLRLAGYRDGYFPTEQTAEVCAEIRAARPHILFVAMSSPTKEYWLDEHGKALGIPLQMGVGGSIDVIAGLTRRAPRWLQNSGLEWLWRLLQEPRRLARRYLVTNTRFALMLAAELLGRRGAPTGAHVWRYGETGLQWEQATRRLRVLRAIRTAEGRGAWERPSSERISSREEQ